MNGYHIISESSRLARKLSKIASVKLYKQRNKKKSAARRKAKSYSRKKLKRAVHKSKKHAKPLVDDIAKASTSNSSDD
jgi:hypothetical protein